MSQELKTACAADPRAASVCARCEAVGLNAEDLILECAAELGIDTKAFDWTVFLPLIMRVIEALLNRWAPKPPVGPTA